MALGSPFGPLLQFSDQNGTPLSGGLLQTYATGGTTPLATFSEATLSTPNTNPVVLDSAGRATVFLQNAGYDLILKTAAGVTVQSAIAIYPPDYTATLVVATSIAAEVTARNAAIAAAQALEVTNRNAAIATAVGATPWTVITTTDTGAQNNAAPGFVGNTIWRVNNAALVTYSGFAAGVTGQQVRVVPVQLQVNFLNVSGLSAGANQLYLGHTGTRSLSGAPSGGSALFMYDANAPAGWRLIDAEEGDWIAVPYAAGNFTANAGTWTVDAGDQQVFLFKMLGGRHALVHIELTTTTLSVAGSFPRVTLPNGLTALGISAAQWIRATDVGPVVASGLAVVSGTFIEFRSTVAGAGFTATANAVGVGGFIQVELS